MEKNDGMNNMGKSCKVEQNYTSMFEENTTDWQDRSTGSMGSQTSGGMTSRKMNAEESQQSEKKQQDENYNKYGHSPEDIQHIKDSEQMIRNGYGENQDNDTNPYLRNMYAASTNEQLSGQHESIQQHGAQKPQGAQQQSGQPQPAQQGNQQRITQSGTEENIGDPMDAAKNY